MKVLVTIGQSIIEEHQLLTCFHPNLLAGIRIQLHDTIFFSAFLRCLGLVPVDHVDARIPSFGTIAIGVRGAVGGGCGGLGHGESKRWFDETAKGQQFGALRAKSDEW